MSDTVEVIVGIVGRAHGIKGEVGIDVRTDEPERRFTPGAVLRREGGGAELVVESARDHSGRLLRPLPRAIPTAPPSRPCAARCSWSTSTPTRVPTTRRSTTTAS